MSRPADRARRFIGRLPNKHSTHLGNTPPASKSPIASDARPRHTSRGFLPWRFAYTGPGVRRATFMRPASANLHKCGSRTSSRINVGKRARRATSIQECPKSLAETRRLRLESVRRDHAGLHSFLSMILIEARRRNASALRLRFSQSLARRLHRPSHANVRSTTHRFGRTTNPFA